MMLTIKRIAKFYSTLHFTGEVQGTRITNVVLGSGKGQREPVIFQDDPDASGTAKFTAQILTASREVDPDEQITFLTSDESVSHRIGDLFDIVRHQNMSLPLFDKYIALMNQRLEQNGTVKVLDVGGRARSGVLYADLFPKWDVTVLDIVADKGVDVVADAHEMSDALGCDRFDGAISISVFEHLAMPWKACVELARTLKLGGLIMIHSHQSIGMHDQPWDFFRFSDSAWHGLFNGATGFEIVETQLAEPVHIVPKLYHPVWASAEGEVGWITSGVIARKVCEPRVEWRANLADTIKTTYPLDER